MDSWNNEQKPDVSVSGQFSGNPYQDQTQPQNAYDQNAHNQPSPNGTGGYNESRSAADQYGGQPGGYNQTQNMAAGYSGQSNPGAGYGQPQNNNYANGYGQPFANYNQPSYQGSGFTPTEMEEPVGVGEWTGLLALAMFVPCIGIILMLVWAFGGSEKKSKSNFCKAYLIICLIKLALYALLFIVWGASLASAIDSF